MTRKERLELLYKLLYNHYGPQHWWPADTALECMVGAILTQNTSWTNVEKAITNLKRAEPLTIKNLLSVPTETLAELIRPSGYYNEKAKKIKNLVNFLYTEYGSDLKKTCLEPNDRLREKLLSIKGIGPETADSILLYACNKPAFVVDAYTHRIFSRHGLVPRDSTYYEIQELFVDSLPEDTALFNEYHALIVRLGKERCRKKNPLCEGCPLESDPHETE